MSDARIDQLLDQLWSTDQQDDMAALAPLLAFS